MVTEGANTAAPTPRDPGRPAFLELFFDLTYVFATISLVKTLAGDVSWTGAAQTLVLLLAFTLVWAVTTWAADTLDLTRPAVQVQFSVTDVGCGNTNLRTEYNLDNAGWTPYSGQFAITGDAIHQLQALGFEFRSRVSTGSFSSRRV